MKVFPPRSRLSWLIFSLAGGCAAPPPPLPPRPIVSAISTAPGPRAASVALPATPRAAMPVPISAPAAVRLPPAPPSAPPAAGLVIQGPTRGPTPAALPAAPGPVAIFEAGPPEDLFRAANLAYLPLAEPLDMAGWTISGIQAGTYFLELRSSSPAHLFLNGQPVVFDTGDAPQLCADGQRIWSWRTAKAYRLENGFQLRANGPQRLVSVGLWAQRQAPGWIQALPPRCYQEFYQLSGQLRRLDPKTLDLALEIRNVSGRISIATLDLSVFDAQERLIFQQCHSLDQENNQLTAKNWQFSAPPAGPFRWQLRIRGLDGQEAMEVGRLEAPASPIVWQAASNWAQRTMTWQMEKPTDLPGDLTWTAQLFHRGEAVLPVAITTGSKGELVCQADWKKAAREPVLWSPESPELYLLEVQAKQGEKSLGLFRWRGGFTDWGFSDGHLTLNGRALELRGVAAESLTPAQLEQLHRLAGLNAVAGSLPASLLDYAQEAGWVVLSPGGHPACLPAGVLGGLAMTPRVTPLAGPDPLGGLLGSWRESIQRLGPNGVVWPQGVAERFSEELRAASARPDVRKDVDNSPLPPASAWKGIYCLDPAATLGLWELGVSETLPPPGALGWVIAQDAWPMVLQSVDVRELQERVEQGLRVAILAQNRLAWGLPLPISLPNSMGWREVFGTPGAPSVTELPWGKGAFLVSGLPTETPGLAQALNRWFHTPRVAATKRLGLLGPGLKKLQAKLQDQGIEAELMSSQMLAENQPLPPVVLLDGRQALSAAWTERLGIHLQAGATLWVQALEPAGRETLAAWLGHGWYLGKTPGSVSALVVRSPDVLLEGLPGSALAWDSASLLDEKPGRAMIRWSLSGVGEELLFPGALTRAKLGAGQILIDQVLWSQDESPEAKGYLATLLGQLGCARRAQGVLPSLPERIEWVVRPWPAGSRGIRTRMLEKIPFLDSRQELPLESSEPMAVYRRLAGAAFLGAPEVDSRPLAVRYEDGRVERLGLQRQGTIWLWVNPRPGVSVRSLELDKSLQSVTLAVFPTAAKTAEPVRSSWEGAGQVDSLLILARIARRDGDLVRAREILESLPTRSEARILREFGELEQAAGHAEKAREYFQRARELAP